MKKALYSKHCKNLGWGFWAFQNSKGFSTDICSVMDNEGKEEEEESFDGVWKEKKSKRMGNSVRSAGILFVVCFCNQ